MTQTNDSIAKASEDTDLKSVGKGKLLFSIYEMFILTAGIAVIVGTAPVVSYLSRLISIYAWMVACSTIFIATTIVVNYRSQARKSVLQGAGQKLADGYKRELLWGKWKKSINLILAIVCVAFTLMIAFALSVSFSVPVGPVPRSNALTYVVAVQQSVLAILSSSSVAFNLIWKLGAGQVEFYERGFCISGHRFYPWNQIEQLSPSAIYKSTVTVTLRPYWLFTCRPSRKEVTLVIWVSENTVEQVLEQVVTSRG
ncbi:MAG: hypothetical protein U0930_17285 [Pirellulales bacterium]